MGGVDLWDQIFFSYRIHIRMKAWWFKLCNHGLNIALSNAFFLFKHSEAVCRTSRKTNIDFLRDIVLTYAARFQSRTTTTNLYGVSGLKRKAVADNSRFDGMGHWPEPIETQRRCALCGLRRLNLCALKS